MTDSQADLLDRLEETMVQFTVPLKQKEGFNDEAYHRLCSVLRECIAFWASSDAIPKKAVGAFVEVIPWLVGCEDIYPESVKDKILDAEMEITDLLLQCAE